MKNNQQNKFLYLFNNDFSRSFKMIISFLAVFVAGHLFVVFKEIFRLKGRVTEFITGGGTVQKFIEENGAYSLRTILDGVYGSLIMWISVGMIIVILFSAIIWLREWYGNNKTVYTMMSIPVSRHKIIAAKFCNVLLVGCVYLSTQIICFFIDNIVMKLILGSTLAKSAPIMESVVNSGIGAILPGDFTIYMLYLIAMLMGVITIFNCVMLQRSYRIKGIILCVIMIVAMGVMYIFIPQILKMFVHERIMYICVLSLLLIVANYYSCYYLLKNKVHV